MFVLIIGGGRVGAGVAAALKQAGHDVTVVEKRARLAETIAEKLPGITVVHGDGDEPIILEAAGISHADAVAAMTNEDEDNLVACLLGRREYGVPATFARVNNPRNEWLYGERFGVDLAVSDDAIDPQALARAITASSSA